MSDYDHAWMRYIIPDGPDQRSRVDLILSAAALAGCKAASERGAGVRAVDVWVPPGVAPANANGSIYFTTDEAPTFETPPLE